MAIQDICFLPQNQHCFIIPGYYPGFYHNSTSFFAFISTKSQKHYGICLLNGHFNSGSKQFIH
jgi:hypothetical protein